jgi:sporulation protein YlmC with PRC-barrel domain
VQLEPFVRSQFIGPEDTAYPDYMSVALEREAAGGIFWPYSAYEDYGSYVGIEQIPYHELGIHRGAHVEASDGRIGTVDEFLINPENSHISHLVLREGHLWGQKDVTIPVSEIEKIEDDVVYLKLNKHTLKQMVGTSIQRNGR